MSTLGLVVHPSSLVHDMGPEHFERPDRLRAIERHLEQTGLAAELERHEPEPAPRELVETVHDASLLDLYERLDAQGGGRIDLDTAMGPGSLEAALCASQGAVDATARVLDGVWDAAFACTRPPGHHAPRRRATSMGFCLTNHVAVAARWALDQGKVSRVLVVDWDAHHGNGTQDIFYDDGRVLYVSLHQFPWYPGTGDVTEVGEGAGRGTTVNVPLPSGSAEDDFERAFDEIVEPAAAAFEPELVLVSAGYDAHTADPLCQLGLTAGAFFRLTRRVARMGPGPVCVLEGGYDLDALAQSVAATLSALLGAPEPVGIEPAELTRLPGSPEAQRWIDRAIAHRASLGG